MGGSLTIWVRRPCCIKDFHVKYAEKNARLPQAGVVKLNASSYRRVIYAY